MRNNDELGSPTLTVLKRDSRIPREIQSDGQNVCLQSWEWVYDLKEQLTTAAAAESKFWERERRISAQLRQSYMLSILKLAAQ